LKLFEGSFFAISLFRKVDKLKFFWLIFLGFIVSLLDLLAIGILSIAISYITGENSTLINSTPFKIITSPFEYLGIARSSKNIPVFLFTLSALILLLKTALVTIVQFRMALFLSRRQVDVSNNLTRRFFSQPIDRVQSIASHEVSFVLIHGLYYLINSTLYAFASVFIETALIVGTFSVLFVLYPYVAIILLIFFGSILGVSFLFLAKKAHRYGEEATSSYLRNLNLIQESVRLHRELRVSGRHDEFNRDISKQVENFSLGYSLQNFLSQLPKAIFEGALVLGLLFLALLTYQASSSGAALALISIFLLAGLRLAPSLIKLQGGFVTLRNLQPSIVRVISFIQLHVSSIDIDSERVQKSNLLERGESKTERKSSFVPSVDFRDVSYRYPGESQFALDQVSFKVEPGQMFGITGETGSGKSTLADLCLGLRIPNRGRVELGGSSPEEAAKRWPGEIAYFSQKVSLIDGTLAENIALERDWNKIDFARVEMLLETLELNSVRSSGSFEFREKMGEDGLKLSGGQRQRLGLARALYSDPRLLILDEVTSAQDEKMESFLNSYFMQLKNSRTILIISHRPESIKLCDSHITLNRGNISE
jgi:ABC-type multidrug transport system fused ATPase/permease subunit